MKFNKLKILSIAICCAVTALWSEAQGMERERRNDEPIRHHQAEIFPTGSVIAFAGEIAPQGWLLCDGERYHNQRYPELYQVVGMKYVNGSVHQQWVNEANTRDDRIWFCVPDLRGRSIVGVDDGGIRVTSNNTLGESGGKETHLLIEPELAKHNHTVMATGGGTAHIVGCMTGNVTISPNLEVSSISGGDQPHNNMQPYQVLNYIINTGEMNKEKKLNIEKERKNKEEIFAIRGSKIDECINQYKLLIADYVPYGIVNKILQQLLELSTAQVNEEILAQISPISTNMQYLKTHINLLLKAIAFTNQENIANPIANLGKIEVLRIIKEDVLESMELYKELHGRPHPRWEEFSKM